MHQLQLVNKIKYFDIAFTTTIVSILSKPCYVLMVCITIVYATLIRWNLLKDVNQNPIVSIRLPKPLNVVGSHGYN
jgi:hypothetical protein